jgi:hypothetical protein
MGLHHLHLDIAVILAAVFIIFAGYLAVGFAGYLAYPDSVDSNVLKSFPMRPVLLKASIHADLTQSFYSQTTPLTGCALPFPIAERASGLAGRAWSA